MWILRILGPIKFCKGPINISNGPLKFGNLHVFEWAIGHWPITRAHHHFGLGLTLQVTKIVSCNRVYLLDIPIHIDTFMISMDLSIGHQSKDINFTKFLSLKIVFISS